MTPYDDPIPHNLAFSQRERYFITIEVIKLLMKTNLPKVALVAIGGMLSLATTTYACSPCANPNAEIDPAFGSKPLGLTDPIPITACETLVSTLLFIPEESELCTDAKALGSYCGCAVETSACQICGGEGLLEGPGRVLDNSMLEALGNDFDARGLAITCDLVESSINRFDSTEQQCLDVPLEELKAFCGCIVVGGEGETPTDDENAEPEIENSCSMCAGGEILTEYTWNIILMGDGKRYPCQHFADLAKQTSPNTQECNDIQDVTFLCGCAEAANACSICGDDKVMSEDAVLITAPDGNVLECGNYDAKLRSMEQSDEQCIVTDEISQLCGCRDLKEVTPCSICPGGEDVTFPDKDLTGLLDGIGDGLGLHAIEHNCGIIQGVVRAVTTTASSTCQAVHSLAKLCGCPVAKNSCNICENGGTMANPYATAVYDFGNADWAKQSGLTYELETSEPLSCALVDSFMNFVWEADEWECYAQELMKGDFCGCPGNKKGPALVWVQRVVATFSIVGSLMILWCILTREKKRWSPYNQILFGISFFDLFSSLGLALATLPVPEELGVYGAKGNEATCKVQGFMIQLGQVSMYYNVALSAYFLFMIKYNWTERKLVAVSKYIHGIVLVTGVALACSSIPFHLGDYRWCYLQNPPYADSSLPGIFFFIVPVSLCILMITVMTGMVVLFVRFTEKKAARYSAKQRDEPAAMSALLKRLLFQSFFYVGAFYVVWPVMFASFMVRPTPSNYWFYVVAAILGPSQGIFNAVIFFQRKKRALKSMLNVKPFLSKISTVFMKRSSEMVPPGEREKRRSSDSQDSQESAYQDRSEDI